MTIFNLITVLTMIGYPKLSDGPVRMGITPSLDSLRIIEKVYIHTDRNIYYPGDDIWFKAYLIDASDRSLSYHSNNLHVELISPFSKIVINLVIRLDGGLGNGDFKLPDTIKSGRYRIRAYTNYMRNYSDHLFFNKEIAVINPTDTSDGIPDKEKYEKNKINLSFFPEGGSLVDNISSAVAFKAIDAMGKGCDVYGDIYSSAGDSITTFKSAHLGMGSFFIRPIPGLSYYSIVKDTTGKVIKTDIPKSIPAGVTLSASIKRTNELLISVRTNPQTLPLVLDHDLLLNFSARKVTLKTVSFKIKSYNNSFTLPIDDLPDGIIMITLSTVKELPLAERLIFIQRDTDFKVKIESDKPVYKQRDSVAIRIAFSVDSGILQEASLSLSAVDKSYNDNATRHSSKISSWFLLESDIRGPIEEPAYYFDPSERDRIRDLDLLLLTQGWRDFEWKYNNMNYYVPEVGFTVSGRVRKFSFNKPLETTKVNIGIVTNNSSLIEIIPVDSSGRFRLDGIGLTGEASLIVSSLNKKGNPQGLVLLDSMEYVPAPVSDSLPWLEALPKGNVISLKQKYEIKENFRKKNKLSDTISLGEVNIISKKNMDLQTAKIENIRMPYGKPDYELIITHQFDGYRNIFEVLRGQVPGVQVGDHSIKIRGVGYLRGNNNPLVLIDGVKKPFAELFSFPVGLIDRIDVLMSAGEIASFGKFGANGVISIITRTGDRLLPDQSANHSANITISGYDEARVFYSPQHLPSFIPADEYDFRKTLFWKPDIILQSGKDQLVKYFNSDNSSTIDVTVEGITTTGIPITARTEYEIR